MSLSFLLATDDTPGNPWIMGGGLHFQKDLPGIEIELYRQIARQLGLELKMVRMPWKRCLFELKAGLLDGIFLASFDPERLESRINIDVLERPRPVELLEMLSKGGLAGVACLSMVADVYISQAPHKFGQIEKVYPPISEKTYFLMLSHQFTAAHPAIAEKIWDTIAAFKTGDVFNSISKRYTE